MAKMRRSQGGDAKTWSVSVESTAQYSVDLKVGEGLGRWDFVFLYCFFLCEMVFRVVSIGIVLVLHGVWLVSLRWCLFQKLL